MPLKGIILYRGPSALDGAPIVVAVQFTSSNRKTGAAPTVSILPDTDSYREAHRLARTVCGACPFLGAMAKDDSKRTQGGCYAWGNPNPIASLIDSIDRGNYAPPGPASLSLLQSHMQTTAPRIVRLGAVGDPAAIPEHALRALLAIVPSGTAVQGYTHQWRRPEFAHLRTVCMASVETGADHIRARSLGWRTFRTVTEGTTPTTGERVCSYEAERLTCSACRACDGAGTAPSITATVHGTTSVTRNAARIVAALVRAATRRTTEATA